MALSSRRSDKVRDGTNRDNETENRERERERRGTGEGKKIRHVVSRLYLAVAERRIPKEGESEETDGMNGGGLSAVKRYLLQEVVCVSSLHLLAADTMMRRIVRGRDVK
jgi:hypothetical protein